MSDDEVQIFHGDRPPEQAENVKPSKAKPKANTIIAKADPAPVTETTETPSPEALAQLEADQCALDDEPIDSVEAAEPAEPEYHFEIDPETLWTMPPAMQERMSGLASVAAETNSRLDEQEKAIARVNKALKQLG
jgi:hypothetical protein